VDYYEGDRSKAIVAKAKTYSTNFLKWFGDWTGEEESLSEIKKQNPYSSEITIGKASPDYDSADMNGAGAMFAIRKNGEYIGSIAVNAYYRKGDNIEPWGEKDTNYVSMSSVGDAVEIEKEFRGKGYGKAAYFEFAK
jgi:RimJ/RimL family protein N-acetyltransferase